MRSPATTRLGRRGTLVIPSALRKRFLLDEGALVIAEERPDGILIRPAVAIPVEIYTPERKAAFLLENVVTPAEYRAARDQVRAMGIDPDRVPHVAPPDPGVRELARKGRTPRRSAKR
jgi:bifunctional DNA-binding transcriptional regulator/antitoxin component of YhaV-PrlF toxin-antitoxin module